MSSPGVALLQKKCKRNLHLFLHKNYSTQSTFHIVLGRGVINARANILLMLWELCISCNRATALKSHAESKQRATFFRDKLLASAIGNKTCLLAR